MSIGVGLSLILLSVAGLLAAMALVHVIASRLGWSAELQRKTVHVTTGLYALTLPLTFSEAWPVLALTALAVLVLGIMRTPALARSSLGSTIHGVARQSYGEIFLALAVGFLFVRAIGQPVLFVLPMLVLTFSDAVAALTGVHYGRRLFPVEQGTKSLEGVVMFFLVTFIIAMVTLLLLTDVPRANVILLALVIAAFGAQIEADSWRGFDNLFVPVGVHLFLQNHLGAAPSGLIGAALLYLAILAALLLAAPRLDLAAQSARGYGVLAFLIVSVSAPHNALLPIAAFAMFLLLRRANPCRSVYPDLDFLAAAAGVAAWWLFAGEWTGHNAINLYNLTFAGVAATFAMLLLRIRSLISALAITAAAGISVFAITGLNAPEARWMPAFPAIILASLVLCAGIAAIGSHSFDRYRSGRAFVIALLVPLTLFAWKVVLS